MQIPTTFFLYVSGVTRNIPLYSNNCWHTILLPSALHLSPLPTHWSCLICSYIFHSYCAPPAVCGVLGWLVWALHAPEPASGTWHAPCLWCGCGYRGLRLVKLVRAFSSPPRARGMKTPSLNQLNKGTSNVYSKQLRLQWL